MKYLDFICKFKNSIEEKILYRQSIKQELYDNIFDEDFKKDESSNLNDLTIKDAIVIYLSNSYFIQLEVNYRFLFLEILKFNI